VLTIGETYFLRDPNSYQLLEREVLPELVAAKRGGDKSLRIWSAGCASGEEAYSLAIVLSRVIPDLADWKLTILATDINPRVLERGREAVYSQWSFRNAPGWLMEYFSRREDGKYQLAPHIRKLVRFSQLNLLDDWGAAGLADDELDVIFCRNVLLYFDPPQIERVTARFQRALAEGGWLFLAPTEVDHANLPGFLCRQQGGALALRKTAGAQRGRWRSPVRETPATPEPLPPLPAPAKLHAPAAEPARASVPKEPEASAPARTAAAEKAPPDERQRAEELYRAGRYQEAAERAQAAAGALPPLERGAALALAARALANAGSLDEARGCLEQALALDRLAAHNHYLLALILEQLKDLPGAIKSLKHALYIDADHLLAYFALGNLQRQSGHRREASRNFANALRLLEKREPQEVLEEAEGMTAGELARIVRKVAGDL
jgi:chemotaxis protein methyltransferase CheR